MLIQSSKKKKNKNDIVFNYRSRITSQSNTPGRIKPQRQRKRTKTQSSKTELEIKKKRKQLYQAFGVLIYSKIFQLWEVKNSYR